MDSSAHAGMLTSTPSFNGSRFKSLAKNIQAVNGMEVGRNEKSVPVKVAKLTEKERQRALWQYSRSGDTLTTVQNLLRFFDGMGLTVTEDELEQLLPKDWTPLGSPVTADFVLMVVTKMKQDFEVFRNDPEDRLTLFVSFGGNPDKTGTADTVEVLAAMAAYGVRTQGSPLSKPQLGYSDFCYFMTSIKGALSEDVADRTPNVTDLILPRNAQKRNLASSWNGFADSAYSKDTTLDASEKPDDMSCGFHGRDLMDDGGIGNLMSMEMSLRFAHGRGDSAGDSAAAALKHLIDTAVHVHAKRMKLLDSRRNETRALMNDMVRRLPAKPIRYNGLLIGPPVKKFQSTQCIPPVMLLREEFKMELLLAEVADAAQAKMDCLLLAKSPSPSPAASMQRGAAGRPASAASSRPSSAGTRLRRAVQQPPPPPPSDPACDLLVREIARTVERGSAAEAHRGKMAAKKKEVALAREASIAAAAALATGDTAPYCLSEADVAVPRQGFEGSSLGGGLHRAPGTSASLPKAKLPDASLLRGSSL